MTRKKILHGVSVNSDVHLKPLEILQNRCIILIAKSPYLSHTDPLFKKYKILKLKDLYRLKIVVYMYNHNYMNLSSQHSYLHFARFRSNLLPAFQRLISTQMSIYCSAAGNWNSVTVHIKNLPNSSAFKCCYEKCLTFHYDN